VFSVNTEAQAMEAMVRYCIYRYDHSFRWTDWPTDLDPNDGPRGVDEIDKVTDELRRWWDEKYRPDGHHREKGVSP
jgi:hypothetical protein